MKKGNEDVQIKENELIDSLPSNNRVPGAKEDLILKGENSIANSQD